MVPFDRAGPDEADDLALIEAGGLPSGATRRLRALAVDGAGFTSGLSIGEFALLDRLGPQPLAQVMGLSVHQIGWQYLSRPNAWQTSGQLSWVDTAVYELETVTRAWDQARRRALDRLVEEARLVEADAVVGVHLHRGEHDVAAEAVECRVSGTAIRFAGAERAAWPVLTDLSVQDYWKLHQAGYAAVGLVATTAVVFVATAGQVRWERAVAAGRNQEYPELSGAVFAARDTARARLLGQARDDHADGIVGMAFEQHIRPGKFPFAAVPGQVVTPGIATSAPATGSGERSGFVVTFHAAGTAVRRTEAIARFPPETTTSLGGLL